MADNHDGTIVKSENRMLLQEHFWFVGTHKESFCFIKSPGDVVEVFSKKILNKEPEMEGEREVQIASQV